jgi:GTPase involved in cell partitioning and DNA repair
VLNKADLLPADKAESLRQDISTMAHEKVPVFLISSLQRTGCELLVRQIQDWLDKQKRLAAERQQEMAHE